MSGGAAGSMADAEEGEGSLRQSTVRGGAYLIARQGVAVVLKLGGVLLITRVLGPTQYGSYVTAYNIYQYAMLLGQAGIGVYILRYPGAVPDNVLRTVYTMVLAMALTLSIALEATRGLVAAYTGVAGYADVMAVMALVMPIALVSIPSTTTIERRLNYRAVVAIEIGGDVAYYAIAAPMVLLGAGPVSLAVAMLVQSLLFTTLSHRLARMVPRFGWDRGVALDIVRYAVSFSFANWIWSLRMLVNPLIVAPLAGSRAVGLVGMTIGLLEMLSIVKTIAWRLSVSVLGRVQDDMAKLRRAVTEGMELQTLAVGTLLLGFGWVGTFVVPIVFGARWAPVMAFYPYVAVGYLTIATFNVHSAVLSVIDRNRDLGLCFVVHIALLAGATSLFVRQFGAIGYGYAEIAAIPSYLLVHHMLARRVGRPNYRIAGLWWAAAVIGLMWREIGFWAIAVPFVALALPPSLARLREFAGLLRHKRGGPVVVAA